MRIYDIYKKRMVSNKKKMSSKITKTSKLWLLKFNSGKEIKDNDINW